MFVTVLTIIYLALAIFIFVRYIRKVLPKISNRMQGMHIEMIKEQSPATENSLNSPALKSPNRPVHEE